jgi:hypothetical protein
MRRKNVILDQTKLDRARRILKTDSETQTIDEALDGIIFAEEVMAGIRAVREAGGIEYFEPRDRPRKARG